MLTTLHGLCYRVGLCRGDRLDAPLIVVGNLTVGGTGKSPLVAALVTDLMKRGWRPGIIARGYGGRPGFWPRVVVEEDRAEEVGDEPLMLFRQCGCPVMVGPDRVASGQQLINQFGCDMIVSDDGFQHFRLKREINIVVVDGMRQFGNGWCLPAGPLREPVRGLGRANILVVNLPPGGKPKAWTDRGYIVMSMQGSDLVNLETDEKKPIGEFANKTVHGVAGIGHPERFFTVLRSAGMEVVPHTFPDHHQFDGDDFDFVRSDECIIMTEKDAVKCAGIAPAGQCWVLPVRAVLPNGFFDRISVSLNLSS